HLERLEYIGDAFGIERAVAFDEARQQVAADRTVGPRLRHAVAQMAAVVFRQGSGGAMRAITGDAVLELRLRPAVAADQDRGLENLWMVAGEHQRELGADAASEHDGVFVRPFVAEYAENIAAHVGEREGF